MERPASQCEVCQFARILGFHENPATERNAPFNLFAFCFVYPNRDDILPPGREEIRALESWLMKDTMKIRFPLWIAPVLMGIVLLAGAVLAGAQTPVRLVGAITAISGNTLTVRTDADGVHQVNVPVSAAIKRITPGQKDLSAAETILFSNLETGDRVLVKLDPDAPAGTEEALQIIAIKQADVALKQQKDREDWQLRGVGGLVKSVDAASGVIVLTNGAGATAKTITVRTTKATMLKRYAPASVRFDAALPAPIDAIHAGDQLRARGVKNADDTEIAAEEVVSGSFRNISGTVASLDAASSTLVVKDLATKKPVTIHITEDAQMRRLPDRIAQMLATRLKGSTTGGAASAKRGGTGSPSASSGGSQFRSGGQGGGWNGQGGGGDPQQMLSNSPAIQLGDLKKGEAVMLVSTAGTTEVTAITLLAGVEPLLEAPAASQNLLSNWSMNSGAPEVAQ
jgi:uncharacterized membrane protein YgcG